MPTTIEWTDATWNPVTGCERISPGCANCYAKDLHDRRHKALTRGKKMLPMYAEPFEVVKVRPERLDAPLHWRAPRRVFVNSMSDLFHEAVPFEFVDRVFAVMALCPQHTFQILTKRADRMREYLTAPIGFSLGRGGRIWTLANELRIDPRFSGGSLKNNRGGRTWPLPNVWLGVSVENQRFADERIPLLLQTPAAVRFISAEPLLGPIDLWNLRGGTYDALTGCGDRERLTTWADTPRIDLVIDGGESGGCARPSHPDWFRSLRDQCHMAGTAYFHKQNGAWVSDGFLDNVRKRGILLKPDGTSPPLEALADIVAGKFDVSGYQHLSFVGKKKAGRLLDGREWNELPEVRQ